ncbi:MAG: AMP-binding protein, partial [Caldilineaceae bacterium]
MIHLFPSNLQFTIEQVRSSQFSSDKLNLTENERETLAFCREWLSGVESFTVNTSGSTGTPKPIEVTRQQMEASALATVAAVGLQPGMQMLVCMPTRFIAGKMMLVRGLVVGMEMTVVEPSSNPLADLPAGVRFDFTALTPMQIGTVIADCGLRIADSISQSLNLQSPISTLNAMHAILLGGGPVSATLEQQLQQIKAPIYHTYGMTETVSHVALRRVNGAEASEEFRPLPGVILGVDERGCLNIRAPMTSDQTVQTNDMVDLHANSSFHWLGRWDNVINSGGVKVQVEKVEQAIERLVGGWGDEEVR